MHALAFAAFLGEHAPLIMRCSILVVDDEAPIRDLLSEFFTKKGYTVLTGGTVEEALRKSNEETLHLVILDVLLPDGDGMETLSAIKAAHPQLPVLIMTGIGFDEELLQEAKDRGASGYVSKTLPLNQLLMEVHRILRPVKG